ncbi:MAG TPA: hypothetical protein VF100_06930, partial [Thermoanaerobaculia bacterium]
MPRERARRPGRGGVRVSGGELRGRSVSVPGEARPTEGRVREAGAGAAGPEGDWVERCLLELPVLGAVTHDGSLG